MLVAGTCAASRVCSSVAAGCGNPHPQLPDVARRYVVYQFACRIMLIMTVVWQCFASIDVCILEVVVIPNYKRCQTWYGVSRVRCESSIGNKLLAMSMRCRACLGVSEFEAA